MSSGNWPPAALIADSVSVAAQSMLRLRSNCSVTGVKPSALAEVIWVMPGNLPELLLERRCHRRGHGLRIGARQLRRDLNGRVVDVRQRGDRQQRIGGQAAQQQANHQQRGRDRPLDERRGDVHGIAACCGALRRGFLRRLAMQDVDMAARLQPVLSIDHDLLVGREPGIDQRLALADLRDRDGTDLRPCCRDRSHRHRRPADLAARPTRDGQAVVPGFEQQPHIDQLARPKPMCLIGKLRLELNRARRLEDLIVDETERALIELDLVVLTIGEHRERPLGLFHAAAGFVADRFRGSVKIIDIGWICVTTTRPLASVG